MLFSVWMWEVDGQGHALCVWRPVQLTWRTRSAAIIPHHLPAHPCYLKRAHLIRAVGCVPSPAWIGCSCLQPVVLSLSLDHPPICMEAPQLIQAVGLVPFSWISMLVCNSIKDSSPPAWWRWMLQSCDQSIRQLQLCLTPVWRRGKQNNKLLTFSPQRVRPKTTDLGEDLDFQSMLPALCRRYNQSSVR